MLVDVDGGQLHYDHFKPQGAAEAPIFILCSMGGMAKDYHRFAHHLARKHETLIMSHRGLAPSTAALPWTANIPMICEDIVRILDHAGIESAHFLGESYGGMLALGMALNFPERVRSQILINTSIAGERLFRLHPKAAFNLITHTWKKSVYYPMIAKMVFSGRSERGAAPAEEWLQLHANDEFPFNLSQKQLIAAAKFHPQKDLQRLQAPTLILYGSNDVLAPPINSLNLHKLIDKAVIEKVAGGGHLLCFEYTELIAERVQRHIANLEAKRAG